MDQLLHQNDITFIATGSGWLYLAVLLDLYSRRVVGWAMSERIDQQLVLDALNMALEQCRPQPGLIHYTDHGRQCSSMAYVEMLKKHGMVQSMSRRGNCYDNAVAESFFSSLNELVNHCSFKTRDEARTAVFDTSKSFTIVIDGINHWITSVLWTMNGRWRLLNLPVREIGVSSDCPKST